MKVNYEVAFRRTRAYLEARINFMKNDVKPLPEDGARLRILEQTLVLMDDYERECTDND